jgi:5'-nucleotidase/UDP-sugar diphosphatase
MRHCSRVSLKTLLFALLSLAPTLSGCQRDEVELSIFHSNDTHMSFHPPKSDEWGLGGLAKLSTLVQGLRAQRERSVFLDAGDWAEGNWYYNLDLGATSLRIFDAMGMDAAVVGNHDYLNGPEEVWRTPRRAQAKVKVLGANFDLREYEGKAEFEETILPSVVFERGGIKVGVIGLSTVDYVYKFWLEPVRVSEPIEAAQRVAKELRPQVDILLVLSHNSLSVNQQVARSVAGVDAVISGHSHEKLGKAILVNNAGRQVPVVETGSWGRFLGELRMKVDPKGKTVRFSNYELHAVSPDLQDDPQVTALVQDADQRLSRLAGRDINEVVGHSEIHLDHDDARTVGLGDLAVKAYRRALDAEVAIEILALTGISIAPGPVTVRDLHDVMPHIWSEKLQKEWTLKRWRMRGSDLQLFVQIIYLTNLLPLADTGFFAFDGLEVTWTPKGAEESSVPQIRSILIQGEPIDPMRRYTVALNDGLILALREVDKKVNLGIDFSQMTDTGLEASRSIIDYGIEKRTLTASLLRAGGRSFTTTADPALTRDSLSYAAREEALKVRLENDGLSELRNARILCRTGLTDQPIAHGTELQVWTSLPVVTLNAPLGALETREIQVPWKAPVGRTPVECTIDGSQDGYPANSKTSVVLHIQ